MTQDMLDEFTGLIVHYRSYIPALPLEAIAFSYVQGVHDSGEDVNWNNHYKLILRYLRIAQEKLEEAAPY